MFQLIVTKPPGLTVTGYVVLGVITIPGDVEGDAAPPAPPGFEVPEDPALPADEALPAEPNPLPPPPPP